MGVISRFKIFFIYITVIMTVIFGVTIVFGSSLVFETGITKQKLSNNIFPNSFKLKNNLVIFTSSQDLSGYKLESGCDLDTKYAGKKDDSYYFLVSYNSICLNPNLYLKDNGKIIQTTHIKFNIYSKSDLFNLFTDLSTDNLNKLNKKLYSNNSRYEALAKSRDKLTALINQRAYQEDKYKLSIIEDILNSRKEKYIVPILGHSLPSLSSKVPNSSRNYRKSYTDGIHHGWDIDAKLGEEVVALDNGLVIRVVKGFQFRDLEKISYIKLDYETKLSNLDLLRGNQVWLKTSSGDIVFYSHLSNITEGIEEGSFVFKGQALGTVGTTGIPDRNYKDYHLHFAVQKNPYNLSKAGKYGLEDYMSWDWYFKGENTSYVFQNQSSIFEGTKLSHAK